MMAVFVKGQDTLAAATLECCKEHFLCNPPIIDDSDVLWICYDTPIAESGEPDVEWVVNKIRDDVRTLGNFRPLILISSQLPVGTTARLEKEFPDKTFAHSPENIRVATAVADFKKQARIVVGRRDDSRDYVIKKLLSPFTDNIILTDTETAEMVKHALNCYLGMSIAFANEIARICKSVGADANAVSVGLKTDQRVSPKAPLRPGAPFGGGHLARDIFTMAKLCKDRGISAPIISSITESNSQQ